MASESKAADSIAAHEAMIDDIKKDIGWDWKYDDFWMRFFFYDKWKTSRDEKELHHLVDDDTGAYTYCIDYNLRLFRGKVWTVAWEASNIDNNNKLTVFLTKNEDTTIPAWNECNGEDEPDGE
jgi:hypothetical protein